MKLLFALSILLTNLAFAQSTLTLEERVSALEEKNEPVILSECDRVPSTVKAAWLSYSTRDRGEDSEYRYSKDLYVPYIKVQQILVNSKIYTRTLNEFMTLLVNFNEEEMDQSKLVKIATEILKNSRDQHHLCK